MKPRDELWRRLERYSFDAEASPGRFVAKLARDNGWTPAYATRVVEEYRRYAYLCCTAGHVVVPSEQVDQAWHQHLLDTQPYWEVFCRQILRKPLHHHPSKGGLDDRRRHVALYERTLAAYEQVSGRPPPADIWPAPAVRFGRDLRQRRVALADYWLIPRRPVRLAAASVAIVAGSAILLGAAPRYAGTVSPLDLDGPSFLVVYALFFVVALIATLILRSRLLVAPAPFRTAFGRAGGDDRDHLGIDPYEAATLETNAHLAINAAIAALERDGALKVEERRERGLVFMKTRYRLVAAGAIPREALPLESAIHDEVARRSGGIPLSDVHTRLADTAKALVTSLRNRGLLVPPEAGLRKLVMVLPLLGLAGLGAAKLVVGLLRDRPVVFLFLFIIATLVVAVVVAKNTRRTRWGTEALRAAKRRFSKREKLGHADVSGGRELAWLVALYGVAVLAGGPMTTLHAALIASPDRGGGGGAANAGGCGGGCGAGDGGGGGCGGGCGGCGG